MCFSISDTQTHAKSPSKCGCLQALTSTSDAAELSFYHSDFYLTAGAPETQSNWLRLETLTGGHWVELDQSQPMINTTSQPLRISYVHTKPKQQKLEASLVLKEFLTKATLKSDASSGNTETARFKLKADPIPKSSYRLKNLNTVVIPRLTPGVYSLNLITKWHKKGQVKKKTIPPSWLQVLPTPPEPPQLVSLNQRRAERGKLTLKLKNVVVGDQIQFYANGEPFNQWKIDTEEQLNQFLNLSNSLPPGKSKVTARLYRGSQWSNDSSPVSVNSRATVFMTRKLDVKKTDFDESSPEKLNKDREDSPIPFVMVSNKPGASQTTPVANQTSQSIQSTFNGSSIFNINNLSLSIKLSPGLTAAVNDLVTQLTASNKSLSQIVTNLGTLSDHTKAINETLTRWMEQQMRQYRCKKYLGSKWAQDPVIVWPDDKQYKASYLFPDKQLDIKSFLNTFDPLQPEIDEENIKAFIESCNNTNEFTLDITFKAMDPNKADNQLRRIITLSENQNKRNFTLGQIKHDLVFRLRTNNDTKLNNLNGMSKTVEGTAKDKDEKADIEGIHFFTKLEEGEVYNVVVSFSEKRLRFWVKSQKGIQPLHRPFIDYPKEITGWDPGYKLKLGDEHKTGGKPDRKWNGIIHSFSLRDVGVTLPRPDEECAQLLFPATTQAEGVASRVGAPAAKANAPDEEHINEQPATLTATDSSTSDKKITIKEFAFPYPASFPVPRYGQRGNGIETEGVVLDQMRLAIAEDGTYRVDFQARTTMRAEINLQLLVKLDNTHWYPITLPRQTILPENYQNFTTGSTSSPQIQPISIQGYAPVFVASSGEITDIRRRGNAVFGTRPPLTTQYYKTDCCDKKPDCTTAAKTSSQEKSCPQQSETK